MMATEKDDLVSVDSENPIYEDLEEEGGVEKTSGEDEMDDVESSGKLAIAAKVIAVLGLIAYTGVAFSKDFERALPLFYIWIAIIIVLAFKGLYKVAPNVVDNVGGGLNAINEKLFATKLSAGLLALAAIAVCLIIVAVSIKDTSQLISLVGVAVFVLGSWMTSWKPRNVNWRPVIGGIFFQFVFAFLILRTTAGFEIFTLMGDQVTNLLNYAADGAGFVFSWLGSTTFIFRGNSDFGEFAAGNDLPLDETLITFPIFAFNVLPTVIFFSALVSMLFYAGVIQVIIRVIGRALAFVLGTSASESLNAAGNIFVGQTEAPLLIRPFLKDMTASEIHAVMTGGFATIAGGVLAIYISFGVPASHLLSASVMSAPAALAISKIVYPETEESKTRAGVKYEIDVPDHVNIIDAAAGGAAVAIQLAINIGGQLIAFVALISFFDAIIAWFGAFIDVELSFAIISGYVFYPVAYVMGVEAADCQNVGTLLGLKIFVNEFVAYDALTGTGGFASLMSDRSNIIATYALCGFSNFASIGIQIGGLTPLAPNKGKVISKLVFSAMIAGNTACFLTACVAGLLFDADADSFAFGATL